MKLQFDITIQEFGIIEEILANNLTNNCQVWVFGSRAKNSALFNSDLDLALECNHKIASKVLTQLKTDFEKSKLPYRVDVLNIGTVEPYFQEIINKKKILFPFKAKNKVPLLRFSEFSGAWEENRLRDISNLITKGTTPTSIGFGYEKEGVNFIKVECIHNNGFIDTNSTPKISEECNTVLKRSQLKLNDMLLSIAGTLGRTAIVIEKDLPANTNQALSIIRLMPDNNLGFINYSLNTPSISKYILHMVSVGAQPNLNLQQVGDMKIVLPCLKEQQKIATFLTAVDTKIEQLSKKQALLSAYKKGVMQKIFSQTIRFKADDGSEFADWEENKLGDVAKISTGNSNREDSSKNSGKYTFFDRSKDVRTSNIFLFDGEAIIVAGEGQNFIPKYFIGKFDLHQRSYTIMDFLNSSGKFIFYYIYQNKNYLLSQAVGSTVKSLRLPIFQKMPIDVPQLKEQTKIANFLSAIDTKIKQAGKQLDASKQFKKALLQQMFV